MDPAEVGSYVRWTAWASSAVFTGTLVAFVVDVRRHGRPSIATRRAFVGFVGAHTIHFLTVLWLAQVTAGQNIREAGGWVGSLIVAGLFYAGSCAILGLWRRRAAGEDARRRLKVAGHVAVVFIGAIFVSSYAVRAVTYRGFSIPVAIMTSAIWVYLRFGDWKALSAGSSRAPAHL
jgi:hypothetical protein